MRLGLHSLGIGSGTEWGDGWYGFNVDELAHLGVDQLVVVASPPDDTAGATDWVGELATRWRSAMS